MFPLGVVINPSKSNCFCFLAGFPPSSCVYRTSSSVGKTITRSTQWDAHEERGPTDLPVKTRDFLGKRNFRDNYWMPFLSPPPPSTWMYRVCGEVLQFCAFLLLLMWREVKKEGFLDL